MMTMINLTSHLILNTHPTYTRNIIGYTDDNTPIIYNTKVPGKFKEDFDFKIAIEMSVRKPKSYAVQFYDKYENEHGLYENIEKRKENVFLNLL